MRRKFICAMLAATMAASLVACGGKKKEAKAKSTINTEIAADEYAKTITDNAEIYKQYVNLDKDKYLNQEIELDESAYSVSEDAVNNQIEQLLSQLKETNQIKEGTTKVGDTINLDYTGTLDGVAFSGGSATAVSYTIGSGNFIDDLDKGLAGLTVGKNYDIPCTFPSDYSSSDLAGKQVIFNVTVNYIEEDVIPELTDEWVSANASTLGYDGCTTVADLTKAVREELENSNKDNLVAAKYQEVYNKATQDLNVENYPEDEVNQLVQTLNDNIQSEFDNYGSYYGISDIDSYITQVYGFESRDAFNDYATEYAKKYLLEKMIVTIIAADNNITVTADDINGMGGELATRYGYDSYDAILSEYGNEMNSEVGYQCLYKAVSEFLANNCVVVAPTTESQSQAE